MAKAYGFSYLGGRIRMVTISGKHRQKTKTLYEKQLKAKDW
jgi:hypothetical protein